MATRIQLRRDTRANWVAANPVLAQGEAAIITGETPQKLVVGDGSTAFNSLPEATLDPSASFVSANDDVVLPMGAWAPVNGTPALAGNNFSHPVWLFDASSAEHIAITVAPPSAWTTFNVLLRWTNHTAVAAADVVWNLLHATKAADAGLAGGTTTVSATAASGAQHVLKYTTLASGLAVPAAASMMTLRVGRDAANAADTLSADAGLIEVRLRKAS